MVFIGSAKAERTERSPDIQEEPADQEWQVVDSDTCEVPDMLLRPHVRGRLKNLEARIRWQDTGYPGQVIRSCPPPCSKCLEVCIQR